MANCNPPCGVAQEDFLIPAIGYNVGVDGGAVEQKDGNGQAHQGVVYEPCCEWKIFKTRKSATHPKTAAVRPLSHTQVRWSKRATQKNVQATRYYVFNSESANHSTPSITSRHNDLPLFLHSVDVLCASDRRELPSNVHIAFRHRTVGRVER